MSKKLIMILCLLLITSVAFAADRYVFITKTDEIATLRQLNILIVTILVLFALTFGLRPSIFKKI